MRKSPVWKTACALILMLILILHSNDAADGAYEGIRLCVRTVIPSLFPFLVISAWISPMLTQFSIPGLRKLAALLGIPNGYEGLLLLGLIGGYPVGAQTVTEYYRSGYLRKNTAQRLLGFCSNAGPSFIFGITGILFSSPLLPWLLWAVHILSACLTALLLPRTHTDPPVAPQTQKDRTFSHALTQAVKVIASICGWIVVCKAAMRLLEQTIPQPNIWRCINGFIELSAGCCSLTDIPAQDMRFILASVYLAFGGVCVMLQTASVTQHLGMGFYPIGKLMQTAISLILSVLVSRCVFPAPTIGDKAAAGLILICLVLLFLLYMRAKNKCGNFAVNII